MASIRETLAKNIKENRQRLGITQAELAEKADISTNFIAMIELQHKFPGPETLESIAAALGIASHQLFSIPPSPEDSLHQLKQQIMDDLDRAIGNAVDKAIDSKFKGTEAKS